MSQTARAAVFLDRDGVLNRAFVRDGAPHPPSRIEDFEILPGVPEALDRLAAAGFALVVVTNQPDVVRGAQDWECVEAMNTVVAARLPVLGVLTCYHDTGDNCPCRKPRPGLILEAARRWRLDLDASFMVGDRWSDVAAGHAAGCSTVLLEMPYSRRERCTPHYCASALPAAAEWILSQTKGVR
jgi:D-glycero-D-manno-heptose 1,7-bisphosphate phosphatase